MKLHLPHSLRTALLCTFSLVSTLGTSNLYAGGMHSQVSLVTYTDFGQNMGRYRVNGVNDLLSSIRQEEGVVITYLEGHDDYTLEHYMPSFESQGDNGAYAAIGYNYIATVNHNGCQNPTFTGRYINGSDSLRYYGVEYRGNTVFCLQAATQDRSTTHDYKVTRLNRLITDVTPSTPMPRFGDSDIAAQLRGRMEYRSGSGSMSLWDLDGYSTGLRSAYGYAIGAVRHIDTVGVNQYGFFTTNVTFDPSQNGISAEDPLPFSPDSGDSGSPVWVWDDATQSYLYMDSYQAIAGRKGIATGAIDYTWDAMERFDVPVTVSGNTVHIQGVTATEEDEEITDGTHTAKLHKGHVIDGAGNSIDYVGVKADNNDYINTWLNLAKVKDQTSWFAYDGTYYNVGSERAMNIEDLFCNSNLVFKASSAEGNVVEVDEDTDLGIGYLQFAIDPESGLDHAEYTLQSNGKNSDGRDYMVNSAGFVVDKGVDLHVTLTNTERDGNDYYYREWRKVGDGNLHLEGQGDNGIFLNVGGQGTTYLKETGGFAAYNVYVGSGTTVVMDSINQIARDFTFGYNGGTLDIRGNNTMVWYRTNTNVDEEGFSINSFSEDSYITNSQAGTTLTLTYREGGETEYLGSFVDTEDGGAVRIRFDAGEGSTTTLRSIHTDLTHQKGEAASGSAVFVDSGKVVLSGSNTVHALGSESGRNTNRYSSTEDWHYADMAGDVHVDNGAEFELGSHARLTGNVYVYTGGTLTIREGVLSTYEYIEGGQRLEDTTSAFYRQFYGLHGNIDTDAGTEVRFEYSAGTTAEQVYTGNLTGSAEVIMDLGDGGGSLRLTGTNTFSGDKYLSGGGLISDNGLDALGTFSDESALWHMEADAFIAANGVSGEELLDILSPGSQGMLALTQDQATDLNPQQQGFSNLFVGALAGKTVHYGEAGETLAATSEGGSPKWLLGGGGGNLIVDGLLQDAEGELVLGNGYTDGIVTLTNANNQIGSITFTGRVTLAYTDPAALGGNVHLDYTRRMLLAAAEDTSRVTADSCGVVLVDNLDGAAPDMRGHAELYIGASGDAQLNAAPQIDTGASYRFGGIDGTLTVNAELADEGGQSSGLVVDGQTYSGGALVFAQAASLTGDVVVRGYDADKVSADAPQGDITLSFTCDNALADAASVTLQDGACVNLNGTTQTFRNLNADAGSVIASAIGTGALNVVVDSQVQIDGELHFEHLVKQGDGTLTLTGANTVHVYDVQDGLLYATTNNSLHSSTVNVYDGGVVSLATGTTNTLVNLHEGGELYLAETTNVSMQRGLKFLGNSTISGSGRLSMTTSEFGVQNLTVTLENTTVALTQNGTFRQKGTIRAEGNSTLIISGGDKEEGHDYLRVFEHLEVAADSTLTLQQTVQETAPTYEIHDLSGQGTLVLSQGNHKNLPAFYKLTSDTDFAGTFKILAGTGYSSHKYMSHTLIQSDNALSGAQVQMQGWSSDSGFITLGIDTANANIQGLSTVDNARSILMAGATNAANAQTEPVSTSQATLTILGDMVCEFKGKVVGGEEGTANGLSIVMDGTGSQTFSGVSVFNDVSALQGTLKITNTSADSSIKGDITVARGANLTISKGYSLNEGKTLHVLGNAADAASFATALTLAGGTIEFSCAQLGAETPALNVSSIVAGSVSIGFTDTESLEERGYLLSNGNWVGSSVDGLDLQYLNAEFNGTADGLYVTFSAKDGFHVWAGTTEKHAWSGTDFGPRTVAFSNTETAVFNDAAQVKDVHIGSDNTAAQLIFDSSQQYTVGNDGSHVVTAATLHHTGSGTTVINGGVQVDEIQLDAGELLVRDAALLAAATVSGNGTLGIDLGEGTAINLPALGEDGIGALRLVSGTLNATGVLNVAREVFVEEKATLNSNTVAFLNDGVSLQLAGTLALNLSGSTTLNTAITGIDGRVGTLALSGGTVTMNKGTALQVGTLDLRQGTMVVHRDGASVREIGTLKLGNNTTFSQNSDSQPSTAMEIGSLVMAGDTATLKEENCSGALAIRSLSHSGSGSATLNLTNSAPSTIIATFYLGGEDGSADDFTGTINLSSTAGGSKRSAAIILNDANVAAHAAVNLASAASGDALLGLGVNAESVEIAGLSSGNGLGNRARVFSGGLGVNTNTSDAALAGDDTVRNLAITTASGADCVFNGTIGKNLNITVGGEGSQSLNGDNTAFNGTLTLTGGTLALGNSGIGSASSTGGFNATLEGGTLKLADNSVNLGTGSLILSGSTTISLDAASTDPALSGYSDGADHENGYLSLTVLRAAAVDDRGATLTGAGVLQGMEFTVTDTAITAQTGKSERSYFVNTAVQYGADAPNTAYAQANALVLNADGAVLNMQGNLSAAAGEKGITAAVAGGTVSLAQGVTLHQDKLTDNQNVKVGGKGTYQIALRQSSENINTYLGVQEHVTLAEGWAGTVEVLGEGGDHSHISLQDYGNSLSTVKLTGNSGWLDAGSFDTNLLLEDAGSRSALIISNGSQNKTETFNGSISGSGTLEKAWSRTLDFKFNGDLSNWTGGFKTTGGTANVHLLAGVTNVAASIQATSLTVGASDTDTANVTFFNTVRVASLTAHGSVTVGLNGTLDLTALTSAAALDSLTLAAGSTLALNHTGWLTISGTLAVADGASLDLTGLSVSSAPQSYVLATGGSVTLGDNVSFTLADESLMARASLSVADDTSLVLTVARGVSDLLWRGADGTWTTDASAMNWYFDGTSRETAFVQGDSARFGTDSNNRTVTLAEDITAGAVAVDGNAAVTVALNGHGLTTGNLAVESGSTLTITGSGRTLETAASNIGGAVSLASATTLTLNGEEASFSLGKVTLNNGSKLDVAAAASVTAESLFVEDASGAEISLAQDMTITAGGSADDKAGALYTMGAGQTLNIHSADAADIKTLTVDKLDIANSNTAVSLQNVTLDVLGEATVGVLITDRSNDKGRVTVGSGATLNFNGSVDWHKAGSSDVVNLTVQDGGAVNVNHGAANTLNDITVNEGGSLSFAADTTTALYGSVTLAEQIANDGTLDFGGRAVAISLADDTATFHFKDAGYTNIDGEEDENGFSHSMMGAVTSGSGNIANGGSVDVTFGGFSFIGLNADGTFGTFDNATYHVRSGEVEYSTLKGSSTITSVALSDNATLKLDAALADNVGITSMGTGGTVEIGGGTTLQAAKLHADAATKLAGEGRYAISCASAPTLGDNVSLGADWNGILSFSGGASNINIQLITLTEHASSEGTVYSTVEFDGASGYLQGGGTNTFASDIILAADHDNRSAMNISNGNGGAVYTFSGKVSGSGTFERSATGPADLSFTFTGDVADWTGKFKLTNAKNNTAVTTLNFTGNTPSREDGRVLIAAGVENAANGKTLNVTVTNGKEVVLTGDFTRTTGTLNLTVDANAAFTGTLSDVSSLTIKRGASVQLLATGETPVQHSVGTIAFDGGDAYNRNLLVAEGVKLTAANINNAWGVGTMRVEGEMDVTSLLKFASGGNGSTLNNIITGNGTINAAALEFSNVGTYNITDLHALNVSGATTFNTSNTVNVSASTLNLNGTVTSSRGSLNLHDGAVVNINGISGTNTLLNLTASAFCNLAFAQGTTNSISGSGSLAATIVNAGNLTLNGTYSLDGFDISQAGTFTGGQQSGNGFLTGDLSIQLVSGGGTVQAGEALELTYFGKAGTLNTETGRVAFAGAGQPQYDTFYVNKAGTSESLANAILKSSGTMESIRLANGTTLAMDSDGATLQHLVLEEHASATLNVTQSGTINSVEGLEAGQTLTVSGISGKVLSTSRLEGNAGSAVVVAENATLALTSTDRKNYYTHVSDLDVQGTISLKGNNGDIRFDGYEDGQVFNMGHLDIDGASGTTYVLTSGGVNYATDIVVKSLSGGGSNHTLQVSDCYNGGSVGMVIDFIIGEAQDHADLYTGKIQYGIGTSSAKAGSGMNVVLKDELVASQAVLDAIFGNTGNAQSATITVDTARAKVKGLTGSGNDARSMHVSGTDATGNRVLEIVGDGNYTYGGKLGANLDVVHSGSGTQSFAGVDGFNGSIEVQAGIMEIMNAASVNVQDVTINNGTLGVYKDGTVAEANEGTLTIKDTKTLTAGKNAKLNANLVMESGSTLDVSATGGAGLLMGSSVTLNPRVTLSAGDMDAITALGFMDQYTLFTGVDAFSYDGTAPASTPIALDSETWVKASELFSNPEFTGGKDYYVFYSGVQNGSNVGAVYVMLLPEPTTGTLSLLALAALAARRRRK